MVLRRCFSSSFWKSEQKIYLIIYLFIFIDDSINFNTKFLIELCSACS